MIKNGPIYKTCDNSDDVYSASNRDSGDVDVTLTPGKTYFMIVILNSISMQDSVI